MSEVDPPAQQQPVKVSPENREGSSESAGERRSYARYSSVSFIGPLPPPELLRGYHEIDPSLADRIVKMAEREQDHRHQMEDNETKHREMVITSKIDNSKRGQHHALIIGLSCIGAIGVISIFAPTVAGAIVGTTLSLSGIGGLVAVYLMGGRKQVNGDEPISEQTTEIAKRVEPSSEAPAEPSPDSSP